MEKMEKKRQKLQYFFFLINIGFFNTWNNSYGFQRPKNTESSKGSQIPEFDEECYIPVIYLNY